MNQNRKEKPIRPNVILKLTDFCQVLSGSLLLYNKYIIQMVIYIVSSIRIQSSSVNGSEASGKDKEENVCRKCQ